jgi:pimeloyl-ACP methyl ester carboxylesterase
VLFLHGYLSSKESFIYQTKPLSKRFRVIAPDLTGFGKSDELPFAYSLDDYVDEVLKLINKLNLDSYSVVAHSFGARIAIRLCQKDRRIKKLVITGGAGLKPKRTLKYYFKVYLYKTLKKIFKNAKLKRFGSSDYKKLSPVMKESFVKIVNEHLDNEVSKISAKTLIIHGELDRETPVCSAKKFNSKIKNSKLKIIKGAGHFAFIDNPTVFNFYLFEFLGEGYVI